MSMWRVTLTVFRFAGKMIKPALANLPGWFTRIDGEFDDKKSLP